MWKVEHETVINGEQIRAEGIGEDATEIVKQMRDDLRVHSPGALSMIRKTIAYMIKQGGGEVINEEDVLRVYQVEDPV